MYCLATVIIVLAIAGCLPRSEPSSDEQQPNVGAVTQPETAESSVSDASVDDNKIEAPPEPVKKKPADTEAQEKPANAGTKKKATYVPVDLSAAFNASATAGDNGFDGYGNAYPADKLPHGRKNFGASPVVFELPDVSDTEKNVVTASGQTLKIAPGNYTALHLIAAATDGDQKAGLVLTYGDEDAVAALKISDWCGKPAFGEIQIASWPRVSGENEDAQCKLYIQKIAVDPAKKLSSITLPKSELIHMFALTLEK
ncbi:MAG: hypothetical protein HQ592_02135 [Planctomycetes bacterium]|nr:hypothetical protein [Planctomycetota bacterium]